ncbi:MAG: hypothetical protein HN886_02330, partial [Woeseiaceae bacterium]|jgi:hypothetical protein|nr:hypothetical protein [Woeseiaceae bacterium]
MSFIEITGQPCSGKTSFISNKVPDKERNLFNQGLLARIFYFCSGINFLGLSRAKILFFWSLGENAPLYFKMNIFRNAVSKFGIFLSLQAPTSNNVARYILDEGVSHLPFLFLKTDTTLVIDFIASELQTTDVHYLISPGYDVIHHRLLKRGHKRLKFLHLSSFIIRTEEIEEIMLAQYPKVCKKFKILKDVTSIS